MHVEFKLPARMEARLWARRSVVEATPNLPMERSHDIALLVHELFVNSLQHAGLDADAVIEIELWPTERGVHIEVVDGGPGPDCPIVPPTPNQTRGMGLFFVDRLADRWGVSGGPGHDGRGRGDSQTDAARVWFEIDYDPVRD